MEVPITSTSPENRRIETRYEIGTLGNATQFVTLSTGQTTVGYSYNPPKVYVSRLTVSHVIAKDGYKVERTRISLDQSWGGRIEQRDCKRYSLKDLTAMHNDALKWLKENRESPVVAQMFELREGGE